METERRLLALAIIVGLCFLAMAVGYFVNDPAIPDWYRTLEKPAWTAPDWLFGPVWTGIYLLLAVAAWRVWIGPGWKEAKGALILFALQLLLNAVWSPVFFGLQRPDLAFGVLVALLVVMIWMTAAFFRADRLAGWLLVPTVLWVAYATLLNLSIWRLNA